MLTLLVAVQLSQRFWNSHAMINMSVWLRTEQPTLASALSHKLGINVAADLRLTQVRVVIGSPRQELGGLPFPRPLPWPLAFAMYLFLSCVFSSYAVCDSFMHMLLLCHYFVSSFWFIPFVTLPHTCIPFTMAWIGVPTCNATASIGTELFDSVVKAQPHLVQAASPSNLWARHCSQKVHLRSR